MKEVPARANEMSDAYLDQAAHWADTMVSKESRGSGDTENARHRVAARVGIPYSTFFALKWRKPKCPIRIRGIYEQMRDAYLRECKRQVERLEHEIAITKAIAGADDADIAEAEALVEAAKASLSLDKAMAG